VGASLVSACAGDVDPHAGHAGHGAPSDASCPEESELDYASFGARFLGRYCVDCHSSALAPAERGGAPFGFDYDTQAALLDSGIEHVDYVAAIGPSSENAFMPPIASPLQPTAEERLQLGEWLACGAP
jgi:hypothetical protein